MLFVSWRTLVGLTILVILFVPIRKYSLPGALPFQLEPYRLLVAVVAGVWLVSLLVDRRVRLRTTGLEAPIFLIVAATFGSVVVNSSRIKTLQVNDIVLKKLTFFLSFLVIFYLVATVIRSHEQVDRILKMLVGGGAVVGAFALVESYYSYNVFDHLGQFVPFLSMTEPPDSQLRGARLRVFASAQHPIAAGALFAVLLPFALYLARRTRKRVWLLAAGLIVLAALSTVSRTSIVMLLVIGWVFFRLRREQVRRLLPVLLPGLIVVHLAMPGTIGTLRESFFPKGGLVAEQQAGAGGRGSGRLADVGPTLREWARQPLFGQGYGTRVVDEGRINALILDDQWLTTLAETGGAGVLGWFWLFRRFRRRAKQAAREDDSDRGWLLTAATASITAFAVSMFTYDTFSFIQVTLVMFVVLALGSVLLPEPEPRPARAVGLAATRRLAHAER